MLLLENPEIEHTFEADDWEPAHTVCGLCYPAEAAEIVVSLCGFKADLSTEEWELNDYSSYEDCAMCLTYKHCPRCGQEL